jgi:hypothetical protein
MTPAGLKRPQLSYAARAAMRHISLKSVISSTARWGPKPVDDVRRQRLNEENAAALRQETTFIAINFFNFGALIAPGSDMTRLSGSYAVDFWNQMWKDGDVDPEAAPPPDSV